MPGFDGTGPRREGPFSGRGEGYCAIKLPDAPGEPAVGYAGQQGCPVQMGGWLGQPGLQLPMRPRWSPRTVWAGATFWRKRCRGGSRGRRGR